MDDWVKLYVYPEVDYDFHGWVVTTEVPTRTSDYGVIECSEEDACALLREQKRQEEFQLKLGWLYTATASRNCPGGRTEWGYD